MTRHSMYGYMTICSVSFRRNWHSCWNRCVSGGFAVETMLFEHKCCRQSFSLKVFGWTVQTACSLPEVLVVKNVQYQQQWLAYMAMDQYLYIPFLGGWTSIYQLLWCELQGYKVLTHCHIFIFKNMQFLGPAVRNAPCIIQVMRPWRAPHISWANIPLYKYPIQYPMADH